MAAAPVRHRKVVANGISMHVAEAGPAGASAPAVLFVHGFPELWYSWRHQMDHLAARGYRCLAPDLRGYGGTTAPPDPTSYTIFHIVGDLVALLDALQLPQVFVVGHDWGTIVSWNLCLLRPDRVRALVNLSVAFMPRHPSEKPLDYFRRAYGDDYYVCRFQEPGIEAEFASFELKRFFKMALSVKTTGSSAMSLEKMRASNKQITLPSWLSEEDISYLASVYAKTGFAGGINYYRCLDLFLGFPVIGPTGSSSAVGSPLRQPLRPLADPSSSCCAALIALSSPLSFTRLWPPDSGPRTQIRCFFLGLPGVTASTPRYTTGRPRPSTWRRRGTDARPAPRARGLPLRAATQARTGARQVGGTPAAHRRQGESDRGSLAPASVRDCESCFHRQGESVVTLFVLTFSFC